MTSDPPSPLSAKLPLALGALGVVFGDIGTSPLYAVRECFHGIHAIEASRANILGVLSLFIWSLTMVVAVKYVTFIMRADNRGEGGIFSLLALVTRPEAKLSRFARGIIISAAITGAALLYGDGFITPSISVLSAVEGLNVATDAAERFIVPITCVILFVLFLVQSRGTTRIGFIFGPIMLVWFFAIALMGIFPILRNPHILTSINPVHAYKFFAANHLHGMVVLGSVVLCITGGEALYADMGHFGRWPIRASWFVLVFPALILNYLGQGALLLESPSLSSNPFFGLVPESMLYPMVGLATIATVIASQAMISGAFSLTRQAVQLGYSPRITIVHTSSATEGQIYIPEVNWAMMIICIGLVLIFQRSSGLAAAYGVAVTANMAVTSIVYYFVVTRIWGWSVPKALPLVGMFLIFDVAYFGANLLKFFDGGWFPLAVAIVIIIIMTTWKDGRAELYRRLVQSSISMEMFLEDVGAHHICRVSGTAVFMASTSEFAPPSLMHHYKHNQVLHELVLLLTIKSEDIPQVREENRISCDELTEGFFRVTACFGFMETPNVPAVIESAYRTGLVPKVEPISYYLGRETLLPTGSSGMMKWRKQLFAFLSRNSRNAMQYFGLPPGRVVELGVQIEF